MSGARCADCGQLAIQRSGCIFPHPAMTLAAIDPKNQLDQVV
jgi:hypothetical protein